MSSRSKQIGCVGELAVMQQFLALGFDVFRDVTDACNVDFIVRKTKLTTVQVKTVTSSQSGYVDVFFVKRVRTNGKQLTFKLDGSEYDVLAYYIIDRNIVLFFDLNKLPAQIKFRVDMIKSDHERSYANFTSFSEK